jgi:glycine cleavage system H protein
VSYPNDFKYSDEHEWINGDGTVGITQYAAEQVGDIVFVELPKVGDALKAGQPFGVIESVKAVSEPLPPVRYRFFPQYDSVQVSYCHRCTHQPHSPTFS